MRRLTYGCGPIPTKRKGYFDKYNALEVSEAYTELISKDALHRWRKDAGQDVVMILTANQHLGMDPAGIGPEGPWGHPGHAYGFLQDTDANRTLWKEVDAQARALHANIVAIRTPAAFTPTKKNLANLENFRRQIIGDVPYQICWEAHGLWDDEELDELADALDMILAVDPYVPFHFADPPERDVVYSLRQPRGRRNFAREDVEDLMDYIEEHEHDVVALFRGGERERNAFAFDAEVRRRASDDTDS